MNKIVKKQLLLTTTKITRRTIVTLLILLSLITVVLVGKVTILGISKYGNNRFITISGAYGYLISGRGCNDMANASDQEIEDYIQKDILIYMSEKKFKNILLEKKSKYERNRSGLNESCLKMINRILLNSDYYFGN